MVTPHRFTALAVGNPWVVSSWQVQGLIWPSHPAGHLLYGLGPDLMLVQTSQLFTKVTKIESSPSLHPILQAKKLRFTEVNSEARGPTVAKI